MNTMYWMVQINQFPQPPAEPFDKPPQLIKALFTLYRYYDIIFSCI